MASSAVIAVLLMAFSAPQERPAPPAYENEPVRFMSDSGYVEFVSRAPLHEFAGTSQQLSGLIDLETQILDFFVDLETLDTGNRRRDRDMRRKYLETHRFPFAEFTGTFTETVPASLSERTPVTVQGSFTMREITHEIQVDGFLTPEDGGIRVTASWEILLEDYNIDRPRIVFYELSDVQRVSIDILLQPVAETP
ncbi:Polyisoprenoid-binding protein YceI [Cyclonatronum proteinivorum]|uniref:Polyisoprenoid-binding protein YceI n=2 Tax=Cyclonatronum proteinivorum TaxID=1457365 RepID=A0A345UNW2_9BACT|nr:Polyisoprenoid-binding protein YceI [Cyclonatronum proteinivorum]